MTAATATKARSAAAKSGKLVVDFDFDKSTPGTVRYKEPTVDGARPAVGTLYITKSAANESGIAGRKIRVTIENAD